MRVSTLQALIAAEVCLILVSFKLGWHDVGLIGLDQSLIDWVANWREQDLTTSEWVLGISALAYLPFLIFSWIWLWNLRPGSRMIYTVVTALGFLFYPFGGPYVSNGWPELFESLGTITSGMILGVLYFSNSDPGRSSTAAQAPTLDAPGLP